MCSPRRDLLLRFRAALVLVLVLVLDPRSARADDIEAARKDFEEGVGLLQNRDYEAARRLFERANAAHHAPQIVYNLAVCEEHLSHPQAAVDAYEAYLAEVGNQGSFAPTVTVAIAQIKARSTQLKIETKPAGARVSVDGVELGAPSPVHFLVPGGRHLVVAQGDGWRGESTINATGFGDTFVVSILPSGAPPQATAPNVDGPIEPPPTPPPPPGPDGLVWGTSFALTPYHLFGSDKGPNQRDATQLMAGAVLEFGTAVSDRLELLARGFVAIGPEAKPSSGPPFSYAYMGGPAASVRVASPLWLGATFLAGRLETVAHDAFYGTDLVFGAMVEASLVVLSSASGQYVLGVQPGALFANDSDNPAFFVPVTFGYRAF